MIGDALRDELFAFLKTGAERGTLAGGQPCTRAEAQERLREMIVPVVELRDVCPDGRGIVAAAPHVSFDHWSEYFCNRAVIALRLGRVVAKHFRDQDVLHIPVSIGRHIHVNRPTESDGPGKPERESPRAHEAYAQYVAALRESGGGVWPLNLLIEFHSHRQTPNVEIATCGIHENVVAGWLTLWNSLAQAERSLPPLQIEPLHRLRFSAQAAKRHGSLQAAVCHRALHIEIPRGARRSEELRQLANGRILEFLKEALAHLNL